jgi:hypothetical protein
VLAGLLMVEVILTVGEVLLGYVKLQKMAQLQLLQQMGHIRYKNG